MQRATRWNIFKFVLETDNSFSMIKKSKTDSRSALEGVS